MVNLPFYLPFTLHFRALVSLFLYIVFRLCYTFVQRWTLYVPIYSYYPFLHWLSSLVLVFASCRRWRGLVMLWWCSMFCGTFPHSALKLSCWHYWCCNSSLVFRVVVGGAFPHFSNAQALMVWWVATVDRSVGHGVLLIVVFRVLLSFYM